MPRSSTTADAFNAVAEGRRRELLSLLAGQERSVNDLVEAMGITQPQVSKHLRVLRDVGLVEVRRDGRVRWYRVNAEPLRPIFEWVKEFEPFWDHQLARVRQRAEKAAKRKASRGLADEN